MTVADLIAALQALPPDAVVFVADCDTTWEMKALSVALEPSNYADEDRVLLRYEDYATHTSSFDR